MGLDMSYQAIPAKCDLIDRARSDPVVGEMLCLVPLWFHRGDGPKPGTWPEGELLWQHLCDLAMQYPGLERWNFDLGRSWDELHYLLSATRRGESAARGSTSSAGSKSPARRLKGGAGEWEHRIIGLSSYGPGIAPGHAIVFKGAKPGNYKIYIDNLRLRHADGTTTPVWTNAKQTWTVKIQPNELYQDIKIRAVDVKDVGK